MKNNLLNGFPEKELSETFLEWYMNNQPPAEEFLSMISGPGKCEVSCEKAICEGQNILVFRLKFKQDDSRIVEVPLYILDERYLQDWSAISEFMNDIVNVCTDLGRCCEYISGGPIVPRSQYVKECRDGFFVLFNQKLKVSIW